MTYDGKPHPAELGHITVPESRRTKSGRTIQVAFVRLKSTSDHPAASARTLPSRAMQSETEARNSLFGNISTIDMQPEICKAAVGDFTLGPKYFDPIYSTVPALFLSGTLDSNTPPTNADHVRWGFPNSTHLVVENGFHETLPDDDVKAVVIDFFKGQDVSRRYLKFDPPHFLTIDEAKQSRRQRPSRPVPGRNE